MLPTALTSARSMESIEHARDGQDRRKSSAPVSFSLGSLLGTIAVSALALVMTIYWHVWIVNTICLAVMLHQGFVWRTCRYRVEIIAVAMFVGNLTGYAQILLAALSTDMPQVAH